MPMFITLSLFCCLMVYVAFDPLSIYEKIWLECH